MHLINMPHIEVLHNWFSMESDLEGNGMATADSLKLENTKSKLNNYTYLLGWQLVVEQMVPGKVKDRKMNASIRLSLICKIVQTINALKELVVISN